MKRKTILNSVTKLGVNTQFLVQIESSSEGILCVLKLEVLHLVNGSRDGEIIFNATEYDAPLNDINNIRGNTFPGVVDAFWLATLTAFVQLCLDIVHLFLFVLICIAPWRLLQCIMYLLEHKTKWAVRNEKKAIGFVYCVFCFVTNFFFGDGG